MDDLLKKMDYILVKKYDKSSFLGLNEIEETKTQFTRLKFQVNQKHDKLQKKVQKEKLQLKTFASEALKNYQQNGIELSANKSSSFQTDKSMKDFIHDH